MELVAHTESDAWLALNLAIFLNLLPLTRVLAALSGSLWARALQVREYNREACLVHGWISLLAYTEQPFDEISITGIY